MILYKKAKKQTHFYSPGMAVQSVDDDVIYYNHCETQIVFMLRPIIGGEGVMFSGGTSLRTSVNTISLDVRSLNYRYYNETWHKYSSCE